jgi:hypothetical protein
MGIGGLTRVRAKWQGSMDRRKKHQDGAEEKERGKMDLHGARALSLSLCSLSPSVCVLMNLVFNSFDQAGAAGYI